jgi:hypothetical protein
MRSGAHRLAYTHSSSVGALSVSCGWDRTAPPTRGRIISLVDEREGKESVTNEVIEAAVDNDPFATPGGAERAFSLLLATLEARYIETGAQEDAAIDAEAILTQADEALVLG